MKFLNILINIRVLRTDKYLSLYLNYLFIVYFKSKDGSSLFKLFQMITIIMYKWYKTHGVMKILSQTFMIISDKYISVFYYVAYTCQTM